MTSPPPLMTPGILLPLLLANNEPAEPAEPAHGNRKLEFRSQEATHEDLSGLGALEPGEIRSVRVKKEPVEGNPFLRYQLGVNEYGDEAMSRSPFAQVAAMPGLITPSSQLWRQRTPIENTPIGAIQPESSVRRRNHERLEAIVTRLQNFNGSVTELLAIASVQQQLDVAFADLERAKNQLKQVLQVLELEGGISNRQSQKKNAAVKNLNNASQRIVQLTKELCKKLQRI